MSMRMEMMNVLNEIEDERDRQDAKWGEQNHPDGTSPVKFGPIAEHYRDECDRNHKVGFGTWLDILLEEVYEAAASSGSELREELIQVAAVAAAWVEAIDRRTA